jgi:hypothetical protein
LHQLKGEQVMINLSAMAESVAPGYGTRAGTGPFGFLFQSGQTSEVLASVLSWYAAGLCIVVGAAIVASFFERGIKAA